MKMWVDLFWASNLFAKQTQGTFKFQVKWEGWDDKKDLTWEPETNLRYASGQYFSTPMAN